MTDDVIKLKKQLKQSHISGLALDIDETLSETNPFWFKHMYEYHKPEGLELSEVIRKYAHVDDVPDWQNEQAQKVMLDILHSNDFNESIPLIHESNVVVNEIIKNIPIVAYISARPDVVRQGTLSWLKQHNFPEAEIILRPDIYDIKHRNLWKAQILLELFPEVIGIVDDSAGIVEELKKVNYQGKLYLYGPQSEEVVESSMVRVCKTWADVLKQIG